ncbi:MAG: FAD:protein FMN transferase [Proteobacteria bacterium]|nr:FAD:protein FMN transferase [Pseudomonadota bacterium]
MNRSLKVLSVAAIVAIFAILALLIVRSEPSRREATFFPMGGIPFKVVAYGRSAVEFDADMAAVKRRVEDLEQRFNRFKEGSELAAVNGLDPGSSLEISSDMQRIIALSREWHGASLGAFDPTVTPLIELWRESGREGRLPDASRIAAARSMVGFDKVRVRGGKVRFARDGMSLDFGAIAKGLIADEVANLLMRRGVARGVIDAGGNGLAFGAGSFRFGIQDPMKERGMLMGAVDVTMGGVVTSGSYERFVKIGGRRYSHIIDPRDGMPVENGMIAATVVGGTGAGADSLATALMVLGKDEGRRVVKSLEGYDAMLVEGGPLGPVVWVSANLASRLVLTKEWAERVRLF